MRSLPILLIATTLSGCVLTSQTKPTTTSARLQDHTNKIICNTFDPIYFSVKEGDSPATIKAIREHNAALASFKCK